jgi:hypothetical protein
VDHSPSFIHDRVQEGMRRATVLGLDVVDRFPNVHIRVEAEIHEARHPIAAASCEIAMSR